MLVILSLDLRIKIERQKNNKKRLHMCKRFLFRPSRRYGILEYFRHQK